MKLKESFVTHKNKDDYMMIDSSGKFAGLVHSNATTAFIVECLKTETTKEAIVDAMTAKYDAPKVVIARDVKAIFGKLRSIGALDE